MKWLKIAASLAVLTSVVTASAHGGRIIARIRPGYDPASLMAEFPVKLIDTTAPMPFNLYLVRPGYNVDAVEAAMRTSPAVVFVEDDWEMADPDDENNLAGGQGAGRGSTIGAVFDPNASRQRNDNLVQQISYSQIPLSRKHRTIRVAILDTGLSPYQPKLWRFVDSARDFINPRGKAYDLPSMTDSNGNGLVDEALSHGTMIAGLVNQFAPSARLVIAKVADSDGQTTAWNLVKGYAFAVEQGAEVINISMGALNDIPALSDVLEWAESHHAVTVAAAGNNNLPELLYPAEFSHAVSVTGVTPVDVKANYSCFDNHARVAAPSNGLYSAWWDGSMGIWSGTSFGTPLVTAAIADGLRMTSHPVEMDPLRTVIRMYGDNIDPLNPNHQGALGKRLNFALLRPRIKDLAP